MTSLYTRKFQSSLLSALKASATEGQTRSEAHEAHTGILIRELSKNWWKILTITLRFCLPAGNWAEPARIMAVLPAFQPVIQYIEPHLKWQDISGIAITGEDEMAELCCMCELIGPDGLLIADTCRLGLLLALPQTVFPAQYHAAAESLFVLSGKLVYHQPGHKETTLKAGETLFNDSFDVHELRIQNQPMLAVYAWTGEIASDPLLA